VTPARALTTTAATAARSAVAQRGSLLMGLGFYVIVFVTVSSLWRSATDAAGGSVAGYDARALVWYIAVTEALTVGLGVRLIEEIADDIAGGEIAAEMLRPASVVAVRLAAQVGRCLPRVAVFAVTGGAIATVLVGPPPAPGALVLVVPALVLAVVANLAAQHAVAAIAFWLRDVRSTWFLYQKLYFILGGMLLPIEVLPPGLASVARALPFAAMAYVPGRLSAGHVEPGLLVLQAGWVVVLAVAAGSAFRAGERRLQAVGG
jgi:ABC-2 type transport system permease protein